MRWRRCLTRCPDRHPSFPNGLAAGLPHKNPLAQLTHLNLSAYHFRLTQNQRRIKDAAYGPRSHSWTKKLKYRRRLESRQELRRMVTCTEQDGAPWMRARLGISHRAASSYTMNFVSPEQQRPPTRNGEGARSDREGNWRMHRLRRRSTPTAGRALTRTASNARKSWNRNPGKTSATRGDSCLESCEQLRGFV
jgi:hypothetical protein